MNYSEIKFPDIANGPGARVSLFVSGCSMHCEGCFNSMTWDRYYGQEFDETTENHLLNLLSRPYIQGLSLLGGEPFLDDYNEPVLAEFTQKVRSQFPEKDIWCWSGFMFEDLLDTRLIHLIDILVDGPFISLKKSIGLQYRGSSNQRVIKVPESIKAGRLILLETNDR